jgi:hypothetical protein
VSPEIHKIEVKAVDDNRSLTLEREKFEQAKTDLKEKLKNEKLNELEKDGEETDDSLDLVAEFISSEIKRLGFPRNSVASVVWSPFANETMSPGMLIPPGYYNFQHGKMDVDVIKNFKKTWWWRWRNRWDFFDNFYDEWNDWRYNNKKIKEVGYEDLYGIVKKIVTEDSFKVLSHNKTFKINSENLKMKNFDFIRYRSGSGKKDFERKAYIEMSLFTDKMIDFIELFIPIVYKFLKIGYLLIVIDTYKPKCDNDRFNILIKEIERLFCRKNKNMDSYCRLPMFYYRWTRAEKDNPKIKIEDLIQKIITPKKIDDLLNISSAFFPKKHCNLEVRVFYNRDMQYNVLLQSSIFADPSYLRRNINF